jgi:hypothetical protein
MFQRIEAERRHDLRALENFYYDGIYALVRAAGGNSRTSPVLRQCNTKIVQMHAKRLQSSVTDIAPADKIPGESPTLYQLIPRHKRRFSRMVRSVHDDTGTIQTSVTSIASVFISFFEHKYRRIDPETIV